MFVYYCFFIFPLSIKIKNLLYFHLNIIALKEDSANVLCALGWRHLSLFDSYFKYFTHGGGRGRVRDLLLTGWAPKVKDHIDHSSQKIEEYTY